MWEMETFRFELDGAGPLQQVTKSPLERRAPGPGEVEVQIVSAGLNFREVLKALGVYPGMATSDGAPITFDGDLAGRIVAAGEGVDGFRSATKWWAPEQLCWPPMRRCRFI